MISIVSKKGFQNGFKTEGHAMHSEHGTDIVCASVSALTQTALLGVLKYGHASYQMSAGFLDVDIQTRNASVDAILDTLRMGLEQITDMYPDNVKIKEV